MNVRERVEKIDTCICREIVKHERERKKREMIVFILRKKSGLKRRSGPENTKGQRKTKRFKDAEKQIYREDNKRKGHAYLQTVKA